MSDPVALAISSLAEGRLAVIANEDQPEHCVAVATIGARAETVDQMQQLSPAGMQLCVTDESVDVRIAGNPEVRVVPTHPGGIVARTRLVEAAVDMVRLAGAAPAALVVRLSSADSVEGPRLTVAQLTEHRRSVERLVERFASGRIPTRHGEFMAYVYRSTVSDEEHVALVLGSLAGSDGVLVRVHSECLTGDLFGSLRCDCGSQLEAALERIAAEGRGVLVPTYEVTRVGESASGTSCGHTSCKTPATTPSMRTWPKVFQSMPATTQLGRKSWPTWGCPASG